MKLPKRTSLGIRARLALLVLATFVPMVVLVSVQFVRERTYASENVEQRTAETARLVGGRIDEYVGRTEVLLQAASLQLRIDPADVRWNNSVLAALATGAGGGGSLDVHDAADRDLGSSSGAGRRSAAGRGHRFFDDALRTGRFAVGDPERSGADGAWVVSFALPIRTRAGRYAAVVYATMRLDSLSRLAEPGTLPPESNVTVLDVRGRILIRNVNASHTFGLDARRIANAAEVLAAPQGAMIRASSIDDVRRVLAWKRLERAPWTVVVGIPTRYAAAFENRDLRLSFLLASLTALLAVLLPTVVARRIVDPIRDLTAGATEIAHGNLAARAGTSASGELGLMARQFNAMADTLEHQTRALRDDEERYRTLFELSPVPMLLFDEETLRFLAVNDAALRLYGWTRSEFLERTVDDLRPDADRPTSDAPVRIDADGVLRQRRRHRRKDDMLIDVEESVARTLAFGRRAVLVVVDDLTERERIAVALRESQEQLRQIQKIEAVGSLAAGIAHDFNNLLTGILGSCDLALLSLPESHTAYTEVRYARDAAMRATDLTRRLLTFSRQQASAPAHVDLRQIVSGMQPLLVRTLGEHVKLDLRLHRDPCTVLADPGQVEQVVLNLLVNARDAMPSGGTVNIEVRPLNANATEAPASGRWVLLAVSDIGTGMDPAIAARVFEPFFTTKERGRGTGLGLSVVFSIVQNAGGHVRLRTAPGEGATFSIFLPFDTSAPQQRPSPVRGQRATGGQETILLVEDDDAVRRVTTRMLEGLGYRVLAAHGAREALDLARDHIGAIELLLTDVVMPGMNGRELAEALRKLRPRIQVVFASGYTDDVTLLQQLRADALFFLQKPFTAESLGVAVRSAIDAPPLDG